MLLCAATSAFGEALTPEDWQALEATGVDVEEMVAEHVRAMDPGMTPAEALIRGLDNALVLIAESFGAASPAADLNHDGIVDERDVLSLGFYPGEKELSAGFGTGYSPTTGIVNIPVLRVDFTDKTGSPTHDREYYEELFFSRNAKPGGSAADYFDDMSLNRFRFEGWVSDSGDGEGGWITAANTRSHYNSSLRKVKNLIKETVDVLDEEVDFSQFDTDGDGFVDGIVLVYQGDSSGTDSLWPHKSWLGPYMYDGVFIWNYMVVPETTKIGSIVHEFGHVMGLPDLYDTSTVNGYYASAGIGYWGLMGFGSHQGNGATPAPMSAWVRHWLGWSNTTEIHGPIDDPITLPPADINGESILIWPESGPSNEFFLLENRLLRGWDEDSRGEGLFIWHVNQGVFSNADKDNRNLDLEQADGLNNLYYLPASVMGNYGDDGDPWPVHEGYEFGPATTPDSGAVNGAYTSVRVHEIVSDGDNIRFRIDIDQPTPYPFQHEMEEFDGAFESNSLSGDGEWSVTTVGEHSGEGCFQVRTAEGDGPTPDDEDILYGPWFDLSTSWFATLSYWAKAEIAEGSYGVLECSADGGGNWETLMYHPSGHRQWEKFVIDLSGRAGQPLKIRFRFAAGGGEQGGGIYLDDFRLEEPETIRGDFFDDAEQDLGLWAIRDLAGGGYPTENGWWQRVEGAGIDGSHAWVCTEPERERPSLIEDDDLISLPLDISGMRRPEVTFFHRYSFKEDALTDLGRLYVSRDNGEIWTEIGRVQEKQIDWHVARYDLSDYTDTPIRLRFNVSTDQYDVNTPGWVIDNIRVGETDAIFPFSTGFEQEPEGWTTVDVYGDGRWQRTRRHSDLGLYGMWCGDTTKGTPNYHEVDYLLPPPLDLRDRSTAALEFSLRHDVVEKSAFYIEASTDGQLSWEPLWELDSFRNLRQGWRTEEIDLSGYCGFVTYIRLVWDSGGATQASGVFIDEFSIFQ